MGCCRSVGVVLLLATGACTSTTSETSTGGSGTTGAGNGSTGSVTSGGTSNGTTTGSTASCSSASVGAIDCAGVPSVDAGLVSAFASGSSAFALNLLGAVVGAQADAGTNVFIAPYSVTAAFAMAYAGADSVTVTQMAQIFDYPTDPTSLAPAVAALGCQLEADGVGPDGGQLDIANAFYGQSGQSFLPTFASLLSNDFGAPLQSVDFTQPETARETINQWISEHTDCFIPNLLQPGDLDPTILWVLVNASYFHGQWTNPFATNETAAASFTVSAQKTVSVPMMNSGPSQYYAPYYQGADFQALELQVNQSKIAVDLLLPSDADGLSALEAELTPSLLDGAFANLSTVALVVQIPKLSLDTSIDLTLSLQSLGLTRPFGADGGNFSGILAQPSVVTGVRHEGVLQLDEGGLSAAGATALGGSNGSATGSLNPPSFIANHPFLIVIRDIPTGTILFLGQVVDPSST